jgi:hypothetical protein
MFTGAAVFAYFGTRTQARLARGRLLADPDPLIAEAGRLWRPPPRWLSQWFTTTPSRRARHAEVVAELRQDPGRAERYKTLSAELFAWNCLESSVAVAGIASLIAVIASVS